MFGKTTINSSRTKLRFGSSRSQYMTGWSRLIMARRSAKVFTDQIGSVARYPLPSLGRNKQRTSTAAERVFSATPTGLLQGTVDRFAKTVAAAGFCPVSCVVCRLRAATTLGTFCTHTTDRWPSGRRISTAYCWPKNRSARVWLIRSKWLGRVEFRSARTGWSFLSFPSFLRQRP